MIIFFASGTRKINIISLGGGYISLQILTAIWTLVSKLSSYLSGITSSFTTCCNLLDLLRKYKTINIKVINAVIQLTALPTIIFVTLSLLLSLIPVSVGLTGLVGAESKLNKFSLQKATRQTYSDLFKKLYTPLCHTILPYWDCFDTHTRVLV